MKNNRAASSWYSNAAIKIKDLNGKVFTVQHEFDIYEAFPTFEGFSFNTDLYERVLDNDIDDLDDLAGHVFGDGGADES